MDRNRSARIEMHKEDSKQKTIDEKDAQKQKSETLKHCKVFWWFSFSAFLKVLEFGVFRGRVCGFCAFCIS